MATRIEHPATACSWKPLKSSGLDNDVTAASRFQGFQTVYMLKDMFLVTSEVSENGISCSLDQLTVFSSPRQLRQALLKPSRESG